MGKGNIKWREGKGGLQGHKTAAMMSVDHSYLYPTTGFTAGKYSISALTNTNGTCEVGAQQKAFYDWQFE